jgi:apolipoprotein N-acyltransferase
VRAGAPACGLLALPLALAGYGSLRLAQLEPRSAVPPLLTAGIVQADISFYARLARQLGTYDAVRRILDAHFGLSRDAQARAPLDLLVWPETVYPTTFGTPKSEEGAAFDREIGAFVAQTGVPLVFGAYDVGPGGEFNAAVFLAPGEDGRLEFETYRKSWLFPLTERVPRWLDSVRLRAWLPWLGSWQPGSGPQLIRLGLRDGRQLPVAPLICYDAVAPDFGIEAVRAGAELLVTLSNDSWFATGEGPHLHLVVSAFRSLETRRPQLRATNTGISAVISATGELLALADVHERAALVASVPAGPQARTLMLLWGDWFGPAALAAGLLLLAAIRWKR